MSLIASKQFEQRSPLRFETEGPDGMSFFHLPPQPSNELIKKVFLLGIKRPSHASYCCTSAREDEKT